jgi:hypothetical protein
MEDNYIMQLFKQGFTLHEIRGKTVGQSYKLSEIAKVIAYSEAYIEHDKADGTLVVVPSIMNYKVRLL